MGRLRYFPVRASSSPTGLAFDLSGNLYAATGGDEILKFSSTGALSVFATSANGVNEPEGLAFDSGGNLYAAQADTIEKFTSNGTGSAFATQAPGIEFLAFTTNAGVPLPLANGYPAPEPLTWVSLLAGFCLLGGCRQIQAGLRR